MARVAQVALGNGSEIYWRGTNASGVGTGTFVKIPSAKSITLPTADREEIDMTDLDSEGNYKEFELGDIDPGESSLAFHFNPTNAVHQQLDAAQAASTLYEFKVLRSTGVAAGYYKIWRGRIKNLEYDPIERNTPFMGTLTIRNNGAPDIWSNA